MAGFASDSKFALRTLGRSPLFTVVAVFSLALGIGANTAIFTLLDQLILRLLPVKAPEQLVMIWTTGPHLGNNRGSRAASYPMYQDFQQKAPAFSHVFCRFNAPLAISFENQTERVSGELVSGNYFESLGVRSAIGRVFTPAEDDRTYKGHPVVVLSHHYWTNRFAGDPGVVGKKILVNNYPMTVIGVSAAGFVGLDPSFSPHLWVPIQMKPLMTPGWDALGDRRSQWIQMFARLKPGHTIESAKASLQPLLKQVLDYELVQPELRETSDYFRGLFLKRAVRVEPAANGYSQMRERASTALIVLACMVGLVLVIACTNVASLLIARAVARQKEIAVRLSIGASRRQLLRQLLVESVLLSVAGGVLGLLLSVLIIRGLLSLVPSDGVPLMLRAEPDWRILAFNFGLAFVAGVVFGLVPALQALRVDIWTTLKDGAGSVAGSGSVRLRKSLVVAQVAVSFLLLAGAGLFVKSLANLKSTNTGFRDIENLVTFRLDPALNGYTTSRLHSTYSQLLERLRAVPGVTAAAYAAVPLLHGYEWDSTISVEGHQAKDGEDMQAFMNSISPGYWQAMGVTVLDGRDFDARDSRGDTIRTVIVNRRFAEHYFGDHRKAVGRHMGFGGGPKAKLTMQIVGVVEDSLYEGPREGVRRQAFVPSMDSGFPRSATFYARAATDSRAIYGAVRREVAGLDATLPIFDMKTLDQQLDETLTTERLIATLSTAFGVLATLLAAIGLYGVMAFVVARRTKEIGIRMALGAKQSAVAWMVMREVVVLLGAGVAIGAPLAYVLSRYVASQLFGVEPTDALAAAGAIGVLATVTASAGFVPAFRASQIDPIRALRYE